MIVQDNPVTLAQNPTVLETINTLRTLSIDMIQAANSGHPGLPLGAAPFAYVLFQNHLIFDSKNPEFINRDRFVLSAGHGSALLYSLLHVYGYDLSLEEIKRFRQWGSKTPGHPEYGITPGVEATTGPLGQGIANAVGMAIAERKLADLHNKDGKNPIDHRTYCLVGDGDLMEGVAYEACSLAGHLKLNKLIMMYDSNDISLDGPTSLTFTENVAERFTAMHWNVIEVAHADTDIDGIDRAYTQAKTSTDKPTLIIFKTTIGYGSPKKAGTSSVHGSPLGAEELAATKQTLGWSHTETFFVPDAVRAHVALAQKRGSHAHQNWAKNHPGFKLADARLTFSPLSWEQGGSLATRESSGKILNTIATANPHFFGGDADLSCSTNTFIAGETSFEGTHGKGRNIRYGVREHAMGAIANGIAYHGGLRTFVATFFCFFDYLKPALRLSALNHLPVIYVFTHDSIGLGEDGPTHQPVEHLAALRAVPGSISFRPADAIEAESAWKFICSYTHGPVSLVLSRQKLKTIARDPGAIGDSAQGAYVIQPAKNPLKIVLFATGSEVELALTTATLLESRGIGAQVVSVPSYEVLVNRNDFTQTLDTVLAPHGTKRVAIEAGVRLGWAEIVGREGLIFSVDRYGASAPANVIAENYGLTPNAIAEKTVRHFGMA